MGLFIFWDGEVVSGGRVLVFSYREVDGFAGWGAVGYIGEVLRVFLLIRIFRVLFCLGYDFS